MDGLNPLRLSIGFLWLLLRKNRCIDPFCRGHVLLFAGQWNHLQEGLARSETISDECKLSPRVAGRTWWPRFLRTIVVSESLCGSYIVNYLGGDGNLDEHQLDTCGTNIARH